MSASAAMSAAADMLAWQHGGFSIDASVRITRIRYVLPRHKAANWVDPGRGRKTTRPGANGVVELSPFEFLNRLADLIPQPRKHRHRYHGVFAPNHKLRQAVTALAIGNVGTRGDAATGGHDAEDCCGTRAKPRSHDTSRKSLGETDGPGRGGVSPRVPKLRRRHPADRVFYRARAEPCDGGRQEPAHFEPEVRKRAKARMASRA
ncbi:MAG: transposase [Pirellulales bacterium]